MPLDGTPHILLACKHARVKINPIAYCFPVYLSVRYFYFCRRLVCTGYRRTIIEARKHVARMEWRIRADILFIEEKKNEMPSGKRYRIVISRNRKPAPSAVLERTECIWMWNEIERKVCVYFLLDSICVWLRWYMFVCTGHNVSCMHSHYGVCILKRKILMFCFVPLSILKKKNLWKLPLLIK